MFVIGFGDSITAGVHLPKEDSYLARLGSKLLCRTFNSGVPGQTTQEALQRLEEDVLARRPNLCIIQFGMNDHVAAFPQMPKVPLPQFRDHLIQMVHALSDYGIAPVLCTVHPIIEGSAEAYYYARHPREWYAPSGAQAWIDRYNEAIREAAKLCDCALADIDLYWKRQIENGVELCDLLRTTENSGADDGVHPTPLGHRLYADCIADEVNAASNGLNNR